MLYAGTTSIFSFKYYLTISIVKKLKRWSKSASNSFIYLLYSSPSRLFFFFVVNKKRKESYIKYPGTDRNQNWTSETLRNEIAITTEKFKSVSVHVPTHLKPANDTEFGHYLAGLIDGYGNFSSKQQLVIVFNSLDASLAYYIKKRIGYSHSLKWSTFNTNNSLILREKNK